jgi:hypothetical protein
MRKQYPENVRRITATIGGKTYCFRSEGEMMWSQYLQFLKQVGEIADWEYEPAPPFYFTDVTFGPVQYKLDFFIRTNKPGFTGYYQEFKRGSLDGQAVTKLRRMAKHYHGVIIELVMMGKPKKETHRMFIARKYVRDNRIVDASAIFRQMGNMIKSAKDWLGAQKFEELRNGHRT